MDISIETTVNAPIGRVWSAWITPEDIKNWNYASDDWCCPDAKIDFAVGGKFSYRMEATDGSAGFDFEGSFTSIEVNKRIEYTMGDNRYVSITFSQTERGILIVETFEAENEHSAEQQKQGWQSILNNFKRHVETRKS